MPKRSRESSLEESAEPSCFVPGALEPATPAARFAAATPYTHVRLPAVFDDALLRKVRKELAQLQRTFKETDLFKVYQTGDLGNLSADNPEHAAAMPATLALRRAIYSEPFRAFVRKVTGCAPLTAQTDCSCNVYERGGHLLCHDDVIGTRCVSYILYLSRPGKAWRPALGGALELYDLAADGTVLPAPTDALAPEFGSMAMFTVQPGKSYHSVQEVASREPRLSVSGWFHAAAPPTGADSLATLAQLKTASGVVAPPRPLTRVPKPRKALTAAHEQKLLASVSPAYLRAETIAAVRAQLAGQGAALLAGFLHPALAEQIRRKAKAADAADGLERPELPPHTAGTRRKGWRMVGPPQLRRYMRYRPPKAARPRRDDDDDDDDDGPNPDPNPDPNPNPDDDGDANGDADGGAEDTAGADASAAPRETIGSLLHGIRTVMHSAPFAMLMSALSGCTPSECASEVRRFRPGLDYTLAHTGTVCRRAALDATLTFVAADASQLELWDSGDVGGFECHVVSAEEELVAAAVYQADEGSDGVTSIHAAFNALSLVARGTNTMKFIKYVSFAAPSSRWDVTAEYT